MSKKLAITKIEKLLKQALKEYGVVIYPTLIPKIANHIAVGYNKAEPNDVESIKLFESILNSSRFALNKYIVPKPISEGTAQYTSLIKVTDMADKFCLNFYPQDTASGYARYIEIGLALIGKNYAINKFQYYDESINAKQSYLQEIEEDDQVSTEAFISAWIAAIKEAFKVTLKPTPISNVSDYINFVWAKKQADAYSANYKVWVQATIEALKFTGTLPSLNTLHGQNAAERYKKYKMMVDAHSSKPMTRQEKAEQEHKELLAKLKNKR